MYDMSPPYLGNENNTHITYAYSSLIKDWDKDVDKL